MNIKISNSELEVMNVIWEHSPIPADGVAAKLVRPKHWNIRTVKTLLSRLVKKGALSTQRDGQRFLYAPLISKDTYAANATISLSQRLFGGKAAPLIAHIAQGPGLSLDDIQELEKILAELKDEC